MAHTRLLSSQLLERCFWPVYIFVLIILDVSALCTKPQHPSLLFSGPLFVCHLNFISLIQSLQPLVPSYETESSKRRSNSELLCSPCHVLIIPASLSSQLLPLFLSSFLNPVLPSLSCTSLPCHCILIIIITFLSPLFLLSHCALSFSSSLLFFPIFFIYFPFLYQT